MSRTVITWPVSDNCYFKLWPLSYNCYFKFYGHLLHDLSHTIVTSNSTNSYYMTCVRQYLLQLLSRAVITKSVSDNYYFNLCCGQSLHDLPKTTVTSLLPVIMFTVYTIVALFLFQLLCDLCQPFITLTSIPEIYYMTVRTQLLFQILPRQFQLLYPGSFNFCTQTVFIWITQTTITWARQRLEVE